MKLIVEAVAATLIKSVILNGKVAFRMVRPDSNADDKIIVPETQEDNSHVVQNEVIEGRNCCTETGVIEDSQTPPYNQQISIEIIENFHSSLEAVEKRFMKIEVHMIGLSNPISATKPNPTQENFYTNLLKNRISELEKQLTDKNTIIDFLSAQIISKPPDIQKNMNKRSDYGQVDNKSDYDVLPVKNPAMIKQKM